MKLFYKKIIKRKISNLQSDLVNLLQKYKDAKFDEQTQKANLFHQIKLHEFAIEQLKSIL